MVNVKEEFSTIFKNTPSTKNILEMIRDLDMSELINSVEEEITKDFPLMEVQGQLGISVRSDKRKNIQTTIATVTDIITGVVESVIGKRDDINMIVEMLFHVQSICSGRAIYICVRRT